MYLRRTYLEIAYAKVLRATYINIYTVERNMKLCVLSACLSIIIAPSVI